MPTELREQLITMVNEEIKRVQGNYPHCRPGEYIAEDIQRAIVRGIKQILKGD